MLPVVKFVRWAVLGSVLVMVLVSIVLAGRSPSSPQPLSAVLFDSTRQTEWGPLNSTDRDLLIKVRQVNLWEGPISELAAQQGSTPEVREVGRKLGIEHAQLDASLRTAAEKLRLALPSQPSDGQRVWMEDIASKTGPDFDKAYVNILRQAHGEVMPLVQGVRAGTANSVVREYAIEVSEFVTRHMQYLEDTGIVDYSLLPPSTAPVSRLTHLGGYLVPITLVLFLIAVAAAAALLRGLSRKAGGGTKAERWAVVRARLAAAIQPGAGAPPLTPATPPPGAPRQPAASPAESLVTTAELLAVLTPPDLDEPAPDTPPRAAGAPSIPTQRAPGPRTGRFDRPTGRHGASAGTGPLPVSAPTGRGSLSGRGPGQSTGEAPRPGPAPGGARTVERTGPVDRQPPRLRKPGRSGDRRW